MALQLQPFFNPTGSDISIQYIYGLGVEVNLLKRLSVKTHLDIYSLFKSRSRHLGYALALVYHFSGDGFRLIPHKASKKITFLRENHCEKILLLFSPILY